VRPKELRSLEKLLPISLVLFAIVFGLTGTGMARETSFWTTERASEFLGGTPECVSIRKNDMVSLTLELDTLLSSEESYFWCLAKDAKGNIYAGSGDGGNVYKFQTDGETSLVLDSPELEVLSLAIGKGGYVYAGTSPGGLIYKISPDGKSSVFFKSGESYVWCLAFDEKGNLYAGTGDRGKVYRIKPDGSGELFYDTGEKHVMCAVYLGGRLFLGTEGSGLVISVSEQGKGQVLYDCDEKEVRDLVAGDDGVVYAAAVSRSKKGGKQKTESGSEEDGSEPQEQKKLASSIYKVYPDGTALKLWTTSRSSVYSLCLAGKDSLIVGTGDDGTIYCLAQGKLELLQKVADSQILDMIGGRGTLVFSTGNRARVYSAGPSFCKEGTLVSKVFDAVGVSRWGSLTWEAQVPRGSSLAFLIRAGNGENPDKTWSAWSEELTSSGEAAKVFPGRFVQWKAILRSSTGRVSPSFRKVTLSYLEKNLAPTVGSVQVMPQGLSFARGGMDKVPERVSQTLPGGVKVEYSIVSAEEEHAIDDAAWARAFRTAVWQASDPNGDRQTFSLFYRGIEEENWKLIEQDFKETVFTWKTASFPDGTYLLKVVASDLPDNTPSEALTGEGISLPFEIDNTPPVVSGLRYTREKGGVRIEGRVSDNMSPVVGLDYSLDGGEWRNVQSSDGLLDSRREEFSYLLEGLAPGEHAVVIRARDSAANVGAGRLKVM
jgi:outer membrane protein assembly factor BamB